MRKWAVRICVLLLTFVTGLFVSLVWKTDSYRCRRPSVNEQFVSHRAQPRFIETSSLLVSDHQIHWYRLPSSNDTQQITLSADFRSAHLSNEFFNSNLNGDFSTLIESGYRTTSTGRTPEPRGVIRFNDSGTVRIFWIDRGTFWFIQAPSLALARDFEQSEIVRSIVAETPTPAR